LIAFLFSALIWLRSILLSLFIFVAFLVFVLYFLAYSPWLIDKISNKYATDYNLSYERIDGNAIRGIEIEGLKYKNQALAKHIVLHWNPAGLIKKELIISNLTFEKANVDTIKLFYKIFDNNSTKNVNKKKSFPFKIKIFNILLELEAFDEKSLAIAFLKTSLKINNLNFTNKNIKINNLVLDIDTNLTSLHLKAQSKANMILGKAQIKPTKAFDTYLKSMNKKVKWKHLSSFAFNFKQEKELSSLKVESKELNINLNYNNKNSKIKGKINILGLKSIVSGSSKKKIKINSKISFANILEEIQKVYTLKKPPILKGKGLINIEIKKLKEIKLVFSSPQISYKENKKVKKAKKIKDISLNMSYKNNKIIINSYALEIDKQKIFAKNSSHIFIEKNKISLLPFWLNDTLYMTGDYDKNKHKGSIDIQADNLAINHKLVTLNSHIKLKASQENNKTKIDGKIIIDGGKIHYNLAQKRFAHDSDIIIKQRKKKEKSSAFMDNLSVNIQIETKKPLIYNKGAISMRLQANLAIQKEEKKPLQVFGAIELLKGGRYTFKGKGFILDKGYIYFTGDPNKPLLEASIKYKSLDYLITMRVSGSVEAPNIDFSSSPYLNKEQILSNRSK